MEWRKYLNPESWHPAAKLFRLMPERELSELAKDIAKNGLLEPIILLEDKVLDGRNRLISCDKAGREPWFEQWREKKMTPTEWVISKNLKRRHLNATDAAIIAVEALPLLEQEAKERWEATSKYSPRDERGRLKPARQLFDGPVDPHWNAGKAAEKAAKLIGTNRQYVEDVKAIKRKDPALYEVMKQGEITIPEAKRRLGAAQRRVTISFIPGTAADDKILGFVDSLPKGAISDALKEVILKGLGEEDDPNKSQPLPEPESKNPAPSAPKRRWTDEGPEFQPEDKTMTLEEAEKKIDESIAELLK